MANSDDSPTDQHFCLRWNNFQANITSQFEALRSSEDFTDVTIACEGQRLLAHKVVLSACSPYFKELFKTNPCSHPIIFMKDVEAQHIIALMEFMYAGEVNVSQAHLSDFLKTAESLKICGLTDTSSELECEPGESSLRLKPQNTKILRPNQSVEIKPRNIQLTPTSTVTSSQDVPMDVSNVINPIVSSPSPKKSKSETEIRVRKDDSMTVNPFAIQTEPRAQIELIPKVELPEYFSDDDHDDNNGYSTINFYSANGIEDIIGNNDKSDETILNYNSNLLSELPSQSYRMRRRRISDHWSPYSLEQSSTTRNPVLYDVPHRLIEKRDSERRNKVIQLGEGIEICEEQLRSIKWSDYRKLTRGLATILFSPAELATCSVTGQRWSRAGNGERPVKPALDRTKVQAIISYVAARFPSVEISRIKQVLAYKCKENSTAFKMKAIRYYGHDEQNNN
ncbi:hypothetical protein ABEB36_008297 [Hypothenemus hampei]|uniref:Uncharacterized protein n=1 Tax=Hypothenemus hampei TaxID=57062 RepID=A0ABD1ELG4_HYPHA